MPLGSGEPQQPQVRSFPDSQPQTFLFFLWTGQTQLFSMQFFLRFPPLMSCAVVCLGIWIPELLFAGVPNVVCFPVLNSGSHGI